MNAFQSRNPYTLEILKEIPHHSPSEVELRLERAWTLHRTRGLPDFAARRLLLARLGQLLEQEAEALGRLATLEMGKLIGAAADEARKCARWCRSVSENADALFGPQLIATEAARSGIRFDPIGPVLAVMPWNFPFWQVIRAAAPALQIGNPVLLKHASNVPQCALALESLFLRAGFPEGAFQVLLVPGSAISEIARDSRIAAATLTGSEAAGASLAKACGEKLKKTVLELGGSDPLIILPSADLETAIDTAVKARLHNNGQSCICAKRILAHRSIQDRVIEGMRTRFEAMRLGDPLDPKTTLGPLALESFARDLHSQVERTLKAGARLISGGKLDPARPALYPATLLTEVPAGAPARLEELFGPATPVLPFETLEEALTLANETAFGLGAAVWTRERTEQDFFIEGLESGSVFVNAMVASDLRLPFGGVKRSGYGRELAEIGSREFANVKTFWVQ